jgi:hypothetical protein
MVEITHEPLLLKMSTPINCLDLLRRSYVEDMASTYTLIHAKERLSSATNKASAPMSSYYPVPLHRLSY